MKRAPPVLLLALVLAGALAARIACQEPAIARSDDAYRMRLVELTLASRRAPAHDRFLAHPGGLDVPWPPLYHAALAFAARRVLPASSEDLALGGIDEQALERLAARSTPALGLLAVLVVFATVLRLAGSSGAAPAASVPRSRAALGAILAAAFYALLPGVVEREALGRVDHHALAAVLALAQLGLVARALHARERSDATLASLLGGLAGGLAMLAAPESILTVAACAGVLLVQAVRRSGLASRDAWRGAVLYGAAAASLYTIAWPGSLRTGLLPDLAEPSVLHGFGRSWTALVLLPAAWLALWPSRRAPTRALVLSLGALALAGSLVDARFEGQLHVALACTLGLVFADRARTFAASPRRYAWALLVTAAPAFAGWIERGSLSGSAARIAGLRWMREGTPSPAPFNSAAAIPDWGVLSAPDWGGSIAYHARRPVSAASFAGLGGDGRSEAAARALLFADPQGLLRSMRELDAAYVVVGPELLRELPSLVRQAGYAPGSITGEAVEGTVLWHLAIGGGGADAVPGLERVFASQELASSGRAGAAGPVVSIWRRLADVPGAPALQAR
ncbi:MAG TPA: hypothetical protein VMS76_05040 [Planctomycetota bacterium]|nr:hypothetical protein [Planctomycetota bacterium]